MATSKRTDPYNPLDDEARASLARLLGAAHGALATLAEDAPVVTRVACLWSGKAGLTLLLSDLSEHARALHRDPACSILLGEPGDRGDPLTHPRLTLIGRATEVDKTAMARAWRAARPKTALYYDFADFRLWRVEVTRGVLNAGFGKAFRVAPGDLPT